MPQKPLTTEHVTVATATIDVKVIRIGARQMTQSVFRQLPEAPLFDCGQQEAHAIPLLGVPWGTVNYHWGECPSDEHLHVVWQQDRRLFRTTVTPMRVYTRLYERIAVHRTRASNAAVCLVLLAEPTSDQLSVTIPPYLFHWAREKTHDQSCEVWVGEHPYRVYPSQNCTDLLGHQTAWGAYEVSRDRVEACLKQQGLPAATLPEMLDWVVQAETWLDVREKAWTARYQELEDLDQLFIAV